MEPARLRALLYCRLSFDRWGTVRSVAEQEAECRAECVRRGWEVVDVVVDSDRGASRFSRGSRIGWEAVKDALAAGRADVLVVWAISRSTRDFSEFVRLRDLCVTAQVLLSYSGRVADLAQSGDSLLAMLDAAVAERESVEHSERLRRAARGAALAGRPAGTTPVGYQRAFNSQTRDVTYVPDPTAAPTVVEIIARVAANESLTAIAADLAARGLMSQFGKPISDVGVRLIARNLTYAGIRTHRGNRYPGNWPPLVPVEMVDAARANTDLSQQQRWRLRTDTTSLLAGLAVCGRCGSALTRGTPSEPRALYVCRTAGRRDLTTGQALPTMHLTIRQAAADAVVTAAITERLKHRSAWHDLLVSVSRPTPAPDAAVARANLAAAINSFMSGRTTVVEVGAADFDMTAALNSANGDALLLLGDIAPGTPFDSMTTVEQRALIAGLVDVTIQHQSHRGKRFDPSRIDLTWKQSQATEGAVHHPPLVPPVAVTERASRALIYARVSQDRTGRSRSVADQERECRQQCTIHGWTVVDAVVENDRSASRFATTTRPEWERVKRRLASGHVDVLVVWAASRATRDLGEFIALRDLCVTTGVTLSYSGRVLDLTLSGDSFIAVLDAALAERESEVRSEEVRRSRRLAAADGRPNPGITPYGYTLARNPSTGWNDLVPDPATAPIAIEIIERVANRESLRSIAWDLNQRQIPARHDGQWLPQTVRYIARNTHYAAIRHHHDATTPATWLPLVPANLVELATTVTERPSGPRRGVAHLLSNILLCGKCGTAMLPGRSNRHVPVYWCRARGVADQHTGETLQAGHLQCDQRRADTHVTTTVNEYLRDPATRAALTTLALARNTTQRDTPRLLAERFDEALSAFTRRQLSGDVLARIERETRRQTTRAENAAMEQRIPAPVVTALGHNLDEFSIVRQREIIKAIVTLSFQPTPPGKPFNANRIHFAWTYRETDIRSPASPRRMRARPAVHRAQET